MTKIYQNKIEVDTRKMRAAALWIDGKTKRDIMKVLKVARQTLSMWFSDPDFLREIEIQRDICRREIIRNNMINIDLANQRAVDILKNRNDVPNVQATLIGMIWKNVMGDQVGDTTINNTQINVHEENIRTGVMVTDILRAERELLKRKLELEK